MCVLKVANQEDNVGKKAESIRDDDHRTLSEIDQWLYLFAAEDDHHRHSFPTQQPPPSSSSSSLISASTRRR